MVLDQNWLHVVKCQCCLVIESILSTLLLGQVIHSNIFGSLWLRKWMGTGCMWQNVNVGGIWNHLLTNLTILTCNYTITLVNGRLIGLNLLIIPARNQRHPSIPLQGKVFASILLWIPFSSWHISYNWLSSTNSTWMYYLLAWFFFLPLPSQFLLGI